MDFLIARIRACLSMTPIEKVFRKAICKKIKGMNYKFLCTLFLQMDTDFKSVIK